MKVSVTVMEFVLVVVGIVLVAVALYFTATFLFGPGEPPEPAGEQVANVLPEGRAVTADDLRATTFAVTARGYRMADVDALIERLAHQLEQPVARSSELHEPTHASADTATATDHEHQPAHAMTDEGDAVADTAER